MRDISEVGSYRLNLNTLCRHPAPRVQNGADLKVGEWLSNGYEPELKRWLQDGVTKYSRSAGLIYQVQDEENDV